MSIMDSIKVAFFDLGGTLVGGKRDWIPGAKETLFKLCQRNIRLGLISNTAALSRPQILELLPGDFAMDLFEDKLVIFSSEVHIEKPDPQIFRLAIQRACVKPGECLFCTEEASHILAAQQEGIITALLQKPPNSDIGRLVERLTSDGLLIR
jgi:FMN phosphatase YigB (HAD superfamily)